MTNTIVYFIDNSMVNKKLVLLLIKLVFLAFLYAGNDKIEGSIAVQASEERNYSLYDFINTAAPTKADKCFLESYFKTKDILNSFISDLKKLFKRKLESRFINETEIDARRSYDPVAPEIRTLAGEKCIYDFRENEGAGELVFSYQEREVVIPYVIGARSMLSIDVFNGTYFCLVRKNAPEGISFTFIQNPIDFGWTKKLEDNMFTLLLQIMEVFPPRRFNFKENLESHLRLREIRERREKENIKVFELFLVLSDFVNDNPKIIPNSLRPRVLEVLEDDRKLFDDWIKDYLYSYVNYDLGEPQSEVSLIARRNILKFITLLQTSDEFKKTTYYKSSSTKAYFAQVKLFFMENAFNENLVNYLKSDLYYFMEKGFISNDSFKSKLDILSQDFEQNKDAKEFIINIVNIMQEEVGIED